MLSDEELKRLATALQPGIDAAVEQALQRQLPEMVDAFLRGLGEAIALAGGRGDGDDGWEKCVVDLAHLLEGMFTLTEARRELQLPGELLRSLPIGGSQAEGFYELAWAMKRRALIDGALFARLATLRPNRTREIIRLQSRWSRLWEHQSDRTV